MTMPAPNVIDSAPPAVPDLLFYDGTCGLCHRWVLFVMRHDPDGTRFRFAPLGGRTWSDFLQGRIGELPDSLVLRTSDARILVRSDAVLRIGERLGGRWRMVSRLTEVLPRWLLDLGYDGVARVRKKLFAPPPGLCPILPAELRARFLE
jgi:predicted DCC family thiol-disulfide oxidoreductase YuxK